VRPRVGLDVDGVYANFTRAFTSLATSMGLTDKATDGDEQPTWDFAWDSAPAWTVVKNSWNWWMTLPPLVDGEDVLETNYMIEHADVFFITSRVPSLGLSIEQQTVGWLKGIGVNADRAVVIAARRKGELCKALGVTAMLDDNVDNLIELRDSGILAVCRSWPYNAAWDGPRAGSPTEFVDTTLGRR